MTKLKLSTIAHVSSAHRWSDNRVHLKEAASLASAGYSVKLIAVEHDVDVPNTGVQVCLLPTRSRLKRMTLGSMQAVWLAFRSKAGIIHLHDPELVWAVPILRRFARKVIYDAHENLPDQVRDKAYLNTPARKILVVVAKGLVKLGGRADAVVAATETIAQTFPSDRTAVVHNYPRIRSQDVQSKPLLERAFRVGYVGGMSEVRGALQMVDSFAHSAFPDHWRVDIAGDTAPPDLLISLQGREGWRRVDYRGLVGPEEARDMLNECRLGMVLFRRNAAHLDALPTKMFEYFASGVPVIASDFPLWRRIVEQYDCGTLVDETSAGAIASAVANYDRNPDLLLRHGKNALAASASLNWAHEEKALLDVYERLSGITGIDAT